MKIINSLMRSEIQTSTVDNWLIFYDCACDILIEFKTGGLLTSKSFIEFTEHFLWFVC